jgi:alkylation response protein AidB-like acyl-CoA dehydrogenase
MPEMLTPDLVELRDRVAELARTTLVPLRDDATLAPAERSARVRAASKAAGLYRLTQPSADAPHVSALAVVVARDTLGQHGVGHLPGLFGSTAGVLADVEEPVRSEYLLPMLAGDRRAGFAFTEPADAPRASWARRDGDDVIVNGQKSYVTGGEDCDFLTALVELEGVGPVMVLVDTDAPGVTLTRRFGSLDGSHHAAFTFADVRVPADRVIGRAGDGMSRAIDKIGEMRLAIAADCVGLMGHVLAIVEERLRVPRRKGGPLATSERARLRYGEARIAAFAARSTVYRTARLVDAGDNAVNECIAAKAFATETVGAIVDSAIQLVGGEAVIEGHPLEAAYRRVRVLRLAEGETDTLRVNVARGHLDLGHGRI